MNSIGLTNVRKPGKSMREVMSSREKPSTRVRSRSRDLTAAIPTLPKYAPTRKHYILHAAHLLADAIMEIKKPAGVQTSRERTILDRHDDRIRATRHDTLAWIGDIRESVEQREDPH